MLKEEISVYIDNHTSEENELLYALNRQTHLRTFYPNMLSGKVQGKFLEMIVHMLQPQRILEIGTFTGYSAIAMAGALPEKGLLFTIDNNEEIVRFAKSYFAQSKLNNKIQFLQGDAQKLIPELNEVFDLVFIDADKEQYLDYYEAALQKVRKGGFLLADNVLWGGKAVFNDKRPDKETRGIRKFNEFVAQDNRVEQVMLSIRDGLLLIRKL